MNHTLQWQSCPVKTLTILGRFQVRRVVQHAVGIVRMNAVNSTKREANWGKLRIQFPYLCMLVTKCSSVDLPCYTPSIKNLDFGLIIKHFELLIMLVSCAQNHSQLNSVPYSSHSLP